MPLQASTGLNPVRTVEVTLRGIPVSARHHLLQRVLTQTPPMLGGVMAAQAFTWTQRCKGRQYWPHLPKDREAARQRIGRSELPRMHLLSDILDLCMKLLGKRGTSYEVNWPCKWRKSPSLETVALSI
ncbi:hypothetical protein TGAM01_v205124 [Trichoderma gamsii]|uniref:Uncharacterized protein n=1 Tax=Trichoderma gamsii TaxID=398673 RepID=A0A2P4ZPG2_9HYPO|nr:hypothetical protein TGAM01_v205124 [Trichoderma gamsii]PON26180.1 hypothetical protein TGAM01_v205124 [Trichoderma gamsii]